MKEPRHDGESRPGRKLRNVVIAAAFPPPLNGLSAISASIAADLARYAHVRRYDLSSHSLARTPAYHLRRIRSVIKAAGGILRNGFREWPCLYIPADGGFGLLYTLILTSLGRICGHAIVVHHHSFSAINRRSRLMSMLVAVAGQRASHVFLCQKMHRQFRENYPGGWRELISSNAVHLPQAAERPFQAAGDIRIGLLSNLTREKGLYLFIEVLRACLKRGLPVHGVLAGPIPDDTDRAAVTLAQSEFAERLVYCGPLYGTEKESFLSELDVFVFPTTYVNEAQPNVVFEAMSAGAAVIAFSRGCLDEDVGGDCGLVVPVSDDFLSAACAQIASWHEDRSLLASVKAAARQRFASLHVGAQHEYQVLLGAICGRPLAD